MQKISIPPHVIFPGSPNQFISVKDHPDTKRAGLGYGILKALGGHPELSEDAQKIIADWSDLICERYGGITPNSTSLISLSFSERLGLPFCSGLAAENAACYPGNSQRKKPSYRDIFVAVWVDQNWPHLCKAFTDVKTQKTSLPWHTGAYNDKK